MGVKAVRLYFRGIMLLVTIAGLILSILINKADLINPQDTLWLQYASTLAPFIVIFHISLIIYWLFHKRIWFLIPLLAISINHKYITAIFGINLSASSNDSSINLTVCSYNVNYFNHSNGIKALAIARLMQDKGVDILAMQKFEAVAHYNLNEIIDEFDSMKYNAIYTSNNNSIGMAIFSKYPILRSSQIKFPNTGNSFMWADLLIEKDTVRVINNHLQTTGFYFSYPRGLKYMLKEAGENFLMRANQAKIVRSIIDTTIYPVIVCGDFNDTPHGYVYSTIKGNNLSDSFIEKGVGLGGTYWRTFNLMRIDMVLVSNHFKIISHKIINSKLSNHKPIFCELEYQNQKYSLPPL
ncbi:MAG: endonuclease/exonuclease/phosphatase family protein [Bacteroidales bacterium]